MNKLPATQGEKFFMGVDLAKGHDESAVCIMRGDGQVVHVSTWWDKVSFKKEVKRLAKRFNIPDEQILWETN